MNQLFFKLISNNKKYSINPYDDSIIITEGNISLTKNRFDGLSGGTIKYERHFYRLSSMLVAYVEYGCDYDELRN